jgi:predicted signal transduction protein with EAL and GGDEF domain
VALYPEHGQTAEALLQRADIAMYAAKRAGGDYHLYTVEADAQALDRMTLAGELRAAIDHDQLRLHYPAQGQLRLRHGGPGRGAGALGPPAAGAAGAGPLRAPG